MTIVLRSLLFVPANRPDRFEKALLSAADAVCLDLEDGVPPAMKSEGRQQIRKYLSAEALDDPPERMVRMNAWDTEHGLRDAVELMDLATRPAAILVPKLESAEAAVIAATVFGRHDIPVVALIETVAGLRQADRIAAVPGVVAVVFGSADYAAEIGCAMSTTALAAPRAHLAQAAGAAGIPCIDGAWLSVRDQDGLRADCEIARDLGYSGKPALHPDQVAIINAAFSPTAADLAEARAIVEAFTSSDGGVTTYRGKMLDGPVVAQARRVLALGSKRQKAKEDGQ